MYKSGFLYALTMTATLVSAHALAGAGQTSAGVTTTIPDTTSASQNVNAQSSNFVQENQALNSGTSAGTASGTATAATGKTGATGATDANGKPIDPNNPNAPKTDAQGNPIAPKPPAAPAAPPAPPPEYVSNMKKVNRTTTDVAVVDAPAASAAAKPDKITAPSQAPAVDTGAPTAPGAQRQGALAPPRTSRTVPDTDKRIAGGTSTTPATTGSSGGSGAAPDSYAFYVGLLIAGVLLAFAAATFLRAERGGKQ